MCLGPQKYWGRPEEEKAVTTNRLGVEMNFEAPTLQLSICFRTFFFPYLRLSQVPSELQVVCFSSVRDNVLHLVKFLQYRRQNIVTIITTLKVIILGSMETDPLGAPIAHDVFSFFLST